MSDQIHSLFDPARFAKAMADIEHDDPEQVPTFRSDQGMACGMNNWTVPTDAMLFKTKVLALLRDELDGDSPSDAVVSELIRRVEGITP